MLRVKDVGCGRVVDDDGVFEVPSDLGQVFDVVPLVVVARFAEEAVVYHFVDIELVQERVTVLSRVGQLPKTRGTSEEPRRRFGGCEVDMTYLRDRSREHNYFVQLSHSLHELIHARSLYDVHIVVVTLYLYRNGEVGLVEKLERCG